MFHLCTIQKYQHVAIDGQVCFHRWLFSNPVKPRWGFTVPFGLPGSTNQNWLCARLLLMAVLIYPVVCAHSCHLLRTQHYCLWPNDREGPPFACQPTPTIPTPFPHIHPLISNTHDITVVLKNYLKNQQ